MSFESPNDNSKEVFTAAMKLGDMLGSLRPENANPGDIEEILKNRDILADNINSLEEGEIKSRYAQLMLDCNKYLSTENRIQEL